MNTQTETTEQKTVLDAGMFDLNAYTPAKIAEKVEQSGVAKARLALVPMFVLSMVAGGSIGLGAMFYTVVIGDPTLSFGVSHVLGGLVFCLGLILVIVGGAELFTGNNLVIMAWVDRRITSGELLRNWVVVYIGNAVGSIGLALLVFHSHYLDQNNGSVALAALTIARTKVGLPFATAFFRGVLCNLLVCLAVWLATAGHTVTDKIVALLFPISAFVASGFEHSVANMYFIPIGLIIKAFGTVPAGFDASSLTIGGFIHNLIPATLGNIVGGSGLVGLVYYFVYRKAH
ncbi:formate/nitrite transporter family protein [Burkholderia multivorans]|uniref:formate/nitrite transporter family protein n=1 Tax=Burkholderia multivorans TaxID=87883 RepID=UPI000CFFCA01|nr:formate/nitrite transporter family protein [Burkholderia multivorans]PRH18936.1 formate transporter FocA [Burkholderia multivorans]